MGSPQPTALCVRGGNLRRDFDSRERNSQIAQRCDDWEGRIRGIIPSRPMRRPATPWRNTSLLRSCLVNAVSQLRQVGLLFFMGTLLTLMPVVDASASAPAWTAMEAIFDEADVDDTVSHDAPGAKDWVAYKLVANFSPSESLVALQPGWHGRPCRLPQTRGPPGCPSSS